MNRRRKTEDRSQKPEGPWKGQGPERARARRFTDLVVWQKAHKLVLAIYRLTARFPAIERYGLTAQIRRATVSVPANIAEGFRRQGLGDKARLFNIAQASLEEVRYYLILSHDLEYASTEERLRALEEVSRLLDRYTSRILESRPGRNSPPSIF